MQEKKEEIISPSKQITKTFLFGKFIFTKKEDKGIIIRLENGLRYIRFLFNGFYIKSNKRRRYYV